MRVCTLTSTRWAANIAGGRLDAGERAVLHNDVHAQRQRRPAERAGDEGIDRVVEHAVGGHQYRRDQHCDEGHHWDQHAEFEDHCDRGQPTTRSGQQRGRGEVLLQSPDAHTQRQGEKETQADHGERLVAPHIVVVDVDQHDGR